MPKRPRILLDSNVFLSYAIAKSSVPGTIEALMDAMFERRFVVLVSKELIEEIRQTLRSKQYFMERVDQASAEALISGIQLIAEELAPLPIDFAALTRDIKDDYLLAYAVAGSADYLVSGDKDLLVLGDLLAPLKIRSPRAFLEELDSILPDS